MDVVIAFSILLAPAALIVGAHLLPPFFFARREERNREKRRADFERRVERAREELPDLGAPRPEGEHWKPDRFGR